MVFNQFENIPRQNKDTEVVSAQKICFSLTCLKYFVTKVLKVVNLTFLVANITDGQNIIFPYGA